MKKLSNTNAESKKNRAYIKKNLYVVFEGI